MMGARTGKGPVPTDGGTRPVTRIRPAAAADEAARVADGAEERAPPEGVAIKAPLMNAAPEYPDSLYRTRRNIPETGPARPPGHRQIGAQEPAMIVVLSGAAPPTSA